MRHGEGGDNDNQRPQAAERQHQAKQEQQVVDAVEDVKEAKLHETPGGLMPARIQANEPRVADVLEGSLGLT